MQVYLNLFIAVGIQVLISILFYILKRKTNFIKLPFYIQQIIIGIAFGLAAVFSTEHGVSIGTAVINVRDAAPITAGLVFGGPAGIIAGLIGGIERWFAVYWGVGAYSRVACTVSTILAGIYAAALRKYMFDNKRPNFGFGIAVAVVMEVIHLSILFLTHLSDASVAYEIVKVTTLPMVVCNAVSVAMTIIAVDLMSTGLHRGEKRIRSIPQRLQTRMLVCIVLAYIFTTGFVTILQTNTALIQAKNLLMVNLEDVSAYSDFEENLSVNEIVENRHIGENGYFIVSNLNGGILDSAGHKIGNDLNSYMITLDENFTDAQIKPAKIKNKDYYYLATKVKECYVVAVIPKSEAFATRDAAMYINSYMEVIVFAILYALIYSLIRRKVVNNIREVNENLGRITSGDLSVTVDVRESDEFNSLSNEINATVDTLKKYIAEANARIDAELEFAKNIQHSALPCVFPAYPTKTEFDINATMDTAKEVGGDFYDFYLINENRLAFLVADVSGKGIPAAMFMMRAKTMIKTLAEENLPVNEILTIANDKLCEGNDAGMFVTAWMGILDIETGHVTFANAGHNPPILYKDGSFEYLRTKSGLVLAGMDGIQYKLQELDLNKGDRIYLYTDGVTEATDLNNNLYGEDRLLKFINANKDKVGGDLLKSVKADIDTFVGEADQFDDITMLLLEYNGK